MAEANIFYTTVDGILFSKDMKTLFGYPSAKKDKTYQMPDTVEVAPFGNRNPYLEVLTISKNARLIGVDMTVELYNEYNEGLLYYTALKEIKMPPDNQNFTVKDGVLYSYGAYGKCLYIYPQGKTDEDFYLPAETGDIQNLMYLNKNPYLKSIYVEKSSKHNGIKNGKLWMYQQNTGYSLDGIELIEK